MESSLRLVFILIFCQIKKRESLGKGDWSQSHDVSHFTQIIWKDISRALRASPFALVVKLSGAAAKPGTRHLTYNQWEMVGRINVNSTSKRRSRKSPKSWSNFDQIWTNFSLRHRFDVVLTSKRCKTFWLPLRSKEMTVFSGKHSLTQFKASEELVENSKNST